MNHTTREIRPAKTRQAPPLALAARARAVPNNDLVRKALDLAALNASNQQAMLVLHSWIEGARRTMRQTMSLHDGDPKVAAAFKAWNVDPHRAEWGDDESEALQTLLAILWDQQRVQHEAAVDALHAA